MGIYLVKPKSYIDPSTGARGRNLNGAMDLGKYGLIESDVIPPESVDLGKSYDSTLVGTRRTLARAIGLNENALDREKDLGAGIRKALVLTNRAILPGPDMKMKLEVGGRTRWEDDFKYGESAETPDVLARIKANYLKNPTPKVLGALMRKYKGVSAEAIKRDAIAREPETQVDEDFTYSNGELNSVSSGAWTRGYTTTYPASANVVSNLIEIPTPSGAGAMYYSATDMSIDDMRLDINVKALNTSHTSNFINGFGRIADPTLTGIADSGSYFYQMWIDVNGSSQYVPALAKWVDGAVTILFQAANVFTPPVKWSLDCQGTTIRILKDDVQVFSTTDSDVSGYVKHGFTINRGSGTQSHVQIDDYLCDDGVSEGVSLAVVDHHRKQQGVS